MTTLAVGVVGAGWMATDYHIPAFESHPRTRVVAVAERDDERRDAAAEEFSLPGYPDVTTMLAETELDVVSICTPPATHESIFLSAVEAGCHVLCEKPLTIDAESAVRMRDAAHDRGVVTQVGYLNRYYENYQRALELLSNALLGDLVEVSVANHSAAPGQGWYYNPSVSGGGVARDLFPHTLDVVLDLFESAPTVTDASVRHLRDRPVEDAARLSLSFAGVPAEFSATWTQTDGVSRFLVVGTEGWLEITPDRLSGEVHGRPLAFEHGNLPIVDVGVADLYPAGAEDPHTARIHDFADHAVAGDTDTAAPVDRGVAIAEILDTAYERAGVQR
ncbi:Gfo/Idh/MocA family protein [Haloarcula sp. GH36]|uniref:Gfo/Idh/MocA family protein n=1 Tax=Haloarcula montana TaxID=3111776 RepID=UPI002D772AD9|nr:Gfo/Idh/MocA family oxidoreductase [Haloarcula sp. GH36]